MIPVSVIAERRVVAHLRGYGATWSGKTVGYAPSRRSHARALARLRAAGVVQGNDGALWVDEGAWDARRAKRRSRALALMAIGVAAAGIAGVTTLRG